MSALHPRPRTERSPGSRRILSRIAGALLWLLAGVGVLSGGLWVANQAGRLQPLVVVSGSMSPTISTGDLVFAVGKPASELAVGEIASLRSDVTDKYVTHRVTSVTTVDGATSVTMRGDANEIEDSEVYTYGPGERVWTHWFTIAGGGSAVIALARPGVLIPGLLGLLALIGFAMLPARPSTPTGRGDDAADSTDRDDTDLVPALLGPIPPTARSGRES